jgi:3-hydroxymyristoyl/3-hydroxydecanoyl-(acyl carrier protein) dehydratase
MMRDLPAEVHRCRLHIPEDHASFAGHFPGRPIVPGAVLLDEALRVIQLGRGLDLTQWRVASAKFLETVDPGTLLTLEHSAPDGATVRFVIRAADRTVASGMLSVIAATPDTHGA